MFRSGHPKNYLILLRKMTLLRSNDAMNSLFNCEILLTGAKACRSVQSCWIPTSEETAHTRVPQKRGSLEGAHEHVRRSDARAFSPSSGVSCLPSGAKSNVDAICHSCFLKPKYRIGHPQNYLFSLSNEVILGWKYPKNIFFLVLKTEGMKTIGVTQENHRTYGEQWYTSRRTAGPVTRVCQPALFCVLQWL